MNEGKEGVVWVKASEELPEDERNPDGSPIIIVLRSYFGEYVQYRTLTPNQITDFFHAINDKDLWEWLKPIVITGQGKQ